MANRWKQPDYIPTPREIEQKCEEIQQRWSERERRRRMLFVATDSNVTVREESAVELVVPQLRECVPDHPDVLTAGRTRDMPASLSV
jgi:hypothetical protein